MVIEKFRSNQMWGDVITPLKRDCKVIYTHQFGSLGKSTVVIASCNEFENKGSGSEFQGVLKNELNIAIYKPLAAASYIHSFSTKTEKENFED
ncbi:hypothetical protein TNCT_159951 [Trichonephila clavata]|uniref:Uncharacterized protein n=1 Tax=Trichonephila clavata TaxID=2740835 RepID=A0A8X6I1F5_TRICU|nr:hypothetical protein TNCT_159951 [Trichonephila clavata]